MKILQASLSIFRKLCARLMFSREKRVRGVEELEGGEERGREGDEIRVGEEERGGANRCITILGADFSHEFLLFGR